LLISSRRPGLNCASAIHEMFQEYGKAAHVKYVSSIDKETETAENGRGKSKNKWPKDKASERP